MSDEQQPDVRWAPIPPKPSNAKRVWLIVGLVVAALAIVGVLLFFLLPRGDAPDPGASGTPTPSTSPTSSPTPTSTPTPEPSITPIDTPPPVVDPSIEAFRGQVGGWLGDAGRGLDIVATSSGQDAVAVVDTLQEDAQRLSEAQPPSSIETQWRDGVDGYYRSLDALRTAVTNGSGVSTAIEKSRTALAALTSTVGL